MICFARLSSSTTSSIWQPEGTCAHAITHRSFAWQGVEDDGERTVWLTHCLLLQPNWWETRGYGPTAAWLHRHPERHAVLHASVSVQRHPSSYFPCSPSVTRFGAD